MNTIKTLLIAFTASAIAACSASKKSTSSASASAPTPAPAPAVNTTPSPSPFIFVPRGTSTPGNEELAAIQLKYKDATIEQLKEGHSIYTAGACVMCHGVVSPYDIEEAKWKDILDNMAREAGITDVQKDAVYKYVLAMKATQPK